MNRNIDVLNRQVKDAFDQVRVEEDLKNKTKQEMTARLSHKQADGSAIGRRRAGMWALRYGIALTSLVLLVTAGILNHSVNAQAAYIRLEGDVAVGLSVNKDDKVVEAEGLNEVGKQLLEEIDVLGMPYREAVDCIMSKSTDAAAEAGKTATQVSVEGEDKERCRRMEEEVSEQCANHEKRHGRQSRSVTGEEQGEQTGEESREEPGQEPGDESGKGASNTEKNHSQKHQSRKRKHSSETTSSQETGTGQKQQRHHSGKARHD